MDITLLIPLIVLYMMLLVGYILSSITTNSYDIRLFTAFSFLVLRIRVLEGLNKTHGVPLMDYFSILLNS